MKEKAKKLVILFLIITVSCVDTTDFETPQIQIINQEMISNTNIASIKGAFEQNRKGVYTFNDNDEAIIEGYIVSSDEAGNFYKKLIIQDNYINPTSGIEVLVDQKSTYLKYNFGRKIYIKMAGLSMAKPKGIYQIGYLNKNEVIEIPQSLISDFIIRSATTEEIVPLELEVNHISDKFTGMFIKLINIQFNKDEIGRTFAGDTFDQFNGERVMVQCMNQWTIILSTSVYSDFKSSLIPNGKGAINAILTKDFYGEKFVLAINNPSSIKLTDSERCDPEYLSCEETENNNQILFYEDFDQIKSTNELESLGWLNFNTNFGNGKYKKRSKNGNVYMQVSAYNSEENYMEAWLVTPIIDLANAEKEVLSFKTRSTFDNGTILTAWVTTDIDVDIRQANWTRLDISVSKGSKNGENTTFVSSGNIGLSCLNDKIRIGFKYQGSDPNKTTTYDIDHILLTGD